MLILALIPFPFLYAYTCKDTKLSQRYFVSSRVLTNKFHIYRLLVYYISILAFWHTSDNDMLWINKIFHHVNLSQYNLKSTGISTECFQNIACPINSYWALVVQYVQRNWDTFVFFCLYNKNQWKWLQSSLFISEIKNCTSVRHLYTSGKQPRCLEELGKNITPYLKALYGLIAVIILLNLLIAIYR